MQSFPVLKLTYFDAPGRGEIIRLALFVGNVPFEDERLSREEFRKIKPTLHYRQLPVLSVDGRVMAQSLAIARYVGALSGIYPTDNLMNAFMVDEILMASDDVFTSILQYIWETDSEKKANMLAALLDHKLDDALADIEKRLQSNFKGPFILGEKISLADLEMYIQVLRFQSGGIPDIPVTMLEKYPTWMSIYNNVLNHTKVQEWNALHPAK